MPNGNFESQLLQKIEASLSNDWKDNHDFYRFGPEHKEPSARGSGLFFFRKRKKHREYVIETQKKVDDLLFTYGSALEHAYELLGDDYSKSIYVELIAFYLLGKKRVKLSRNNSKYWQFLRLAEKCARGNDRLPLNFLNWHLNRFDLSEFGYDIQAYLRPTTVVNEFLLEQYRYAHGSVDIGVCESDFVIDAGAGWGDTALYFADKAGPASLVLSFDFIPANIAVFQKNLSLNPSHKTRITLTSNPLWERSNVECYFADNGPGSRVKLEAFSGMDGCAKTVSIDDFVGERKLQKLNYIKMDIEGAELPALRGAVNTLQRYRPSLAIAIYHSLDDYVQIIDWLNDLSLGYRFYVDHFTIHWEETVLFAQIETGSPNDHLEQNR